MSNPLVDSAVGFRPPSVLWWDIFEDKYQVEVSRITDFIGNLAIFDNQQGKMIYETTVGLPRGPKTIADPDDVVFWTDLALTVIDNHRIGSHK